MKQLVFYLILIFSASSAYSQIDNEFWFVAPEVSDNGSTNLDKPIVLKITTFNVEANIIISIPAQPEMVPIEATIPPNSSQTYNLTPWLSNLENTPSNTILNKGLLITSSSNITAYYEVLSGGSTFGAARNNPEAFVLKGRNALGNEFYIPSQNLVENSPSYFPLPRNTFDIVASEDNTNITITPSKNIEGHAANIPFTITLNRGETYSARAVSNLPAQHLNGSHVLADKPIAITVTDDLLYGPFFGGGNCADLVGDQIVPIKNIGRKYIATKTELGGPGDYLFVTATQDGTVVFKDGGTTPICTLDAGETYNFPIGPLQSSYVESNFDIYVWQLAGSGCELGASILPSIDCTGSSNVSYVRSSEYQLYMNLLTRVENIAGFEINGNPVLSSIFTPVPGTSGQWFNGKLFLDIAEYPYNSTIKIKNSLGLFHLSTTDINGGGTSYGYFSNYGDLVLEMEDSIDVCMNDTIRLEGVNMESSIHLWTSPDGNSYSTRELIIPNSSSINSGWYIYNISSANCSAMDSIYVNVLPAPAFDYVLSDTGICIGEKVQLHVNKDENDEVRILPNIWTSSDGVNFSCEPLVTTEYIIELVNSLGCKNHDTFIIYVDSVPDLNAYALDSVIGCHKNSTQLFASNAETYKWRPALMLSNPNIYNPYAHPIEKTSFIVTGITKFGCIAYDTVIVDFFNNGYELIPNVFSPNNDGLNDYFRPYIYCIFEMKSMRIYNRFGEMVFVTYDQNEGWNGKNINNDKECDLGVYFWIIEGVDKEGNSIIRKGDVTLLR